MILCECGEFITTETFKVFIKTSANPSTLTFGHTKCGRIFNFIDGEKPRKYSSRKELKSLAVRFAKKYQMDYGTFERFLVEINRLKSSGNLSDQDIFQEALCRLQINGS